MNTTTRRTLYTTTTIRSTGFPGALAFSAAVVYRGRRHSAPGVSARAAVHSAVRKARAYDALDDALA